MYLDFTVEIPSAPGKITYRKKKNATYVYFEYDRIYDPQKQYTTPKRVTIGKRCAQDPSRMQPNEKFLKYFPDVEIPEESDRTIRSSSLRIGDFIVIRKVLREYGIPDILCKYMEEKDVGLFLDLVAYSIVSEDNAGQYYPNYAYGHPLFSEHMRIYSDSKVSSFLHSLTDEQSAGFLNEWNSRQDQREKVYISYDSTNKNCQAGDLSIVEYGHPKEDRGLPIFNYAVAYDTNNEKPLFYEAYPGSITDVSQFNYMISKARAYGYRKIGFILDRGYFSQESFRKMDELGYSFIIMAKGMADFIRDIVKEKAGSFETKRQCYVEDYDVYGTTVKRKIRERDQKERYIHIFHSVEKECAERKQLEKRLKGLKFFLRKHVNEAKVFGRQIEHYFILHYNDQADPPVFQFFEERIDVIEEELRYSGYFCIITSQPMTAKDAIRIYKSRDASEKLFRGDKSYLGNRSLRVSSEEAAASKIFIEFVALIVRNRIYTKLQEYARGMEKTPNYMTVPAALQELEKIEMVRLTDDIYRLDHAVTKTQKTILQAFGIDVPLVKYYADEISKSLKNAKEVRKR